jgi:hypothetical protein
MKLIATSNALAAAYIALLVAPTVKAGKAGLRQVDRSLSQHQERILETPPCAICKDMYDSLKESTSVYSCEGTCDFMAEGLGGGPEDRTSKAAAPRSSFTRARTAPELTLASASPSPSSSSSPSSSRLRILSPRGHGHGRVRPAVRDRPRRVDGGRERRVGLLVRRPVLDPGEHSDGWQ